MQPHGMHGKKEDWRAVRDQAIDEFAAAAVGAEAEPEPSLWEVSDEPPVASP